MKETQNRFERHKKLTVIIFCIVCFIVIDLIMGLVFLKRRTDINLRISDPYYHHTLLANHKDIDLWNIPHDIYTNNLGFKDSVIRDIQLKVDKHRILFIGDSFTEGIGVPYHDTFVGRIDKKMKDYNYDVLNAAVASYSPKLYYLKIKRLLELGLKTDEIFVFIDISDTQNELEYSTWKPTTSNSPRALWEKYSHKIDHFFEQYSFSYLHIIRPILFGVTTQRLHDMFFDKPKEYNTESKNKYIADIARWTYDDEVWDDWGTRGMAYEINYIDELYNLCIKNNIKLSLAVYPWPENIKNNDLYGRQVTLWYLFTKDKGIEFYNFFPTFISSNISKEKILNDYFIFRDVHWNSLGHELVADEWFRKYNKYNKLN